MFVQSLCDSVRKLFYSNENQLQLSEFPMATLETWSKAGIRVLEFKQPGNCLHQDTSEGESEGDRKIRKMDFQKANGGFSLQTTGHFQISVGWKILGMSHKLLQLLCEMESHEHV